MIEEKQELVEIVEIWMPVKKGGEAYDFNAGKNLKRVALIANGKVIKLEKGFWVERSYMSERSYKESITPTHR